jgi:hypothetical protein
VTADAFRLGIVGCEGIVASYDVPRGVAGAAEQAAVDAAVPEMVR